MEQLFIAQNGVNPVVKKYAANGNAYREYSSEIQLDWF